MAARLRAAGGILMGKTNVPVMLADFQTSNPIFGRTNNPWDTARTPGGSSGGAAAALASGMTPFEIGTDLSASIRLPAHFCGVFGLKPTERRVPLTGLIPGLPGPRPLRIMSSIGPMARSAEDLALLYAIIAGPDGRDTEVPPVAVEESARADLRDVRIAFAPGFSSIPVAAEIRHRGRPARRAETAGDADAVPRGTGPARPVHRCLGAILRPVGCAPLPTRTGDGVPALRTGDTLTGRWTGGCLLDGQCLRRALQLHRPPRHRAAIHPGPRRPTNWDPASG